MNTIATTYPHASMPTSNGVESGLWASIRTALRRIATRSDTVAPVRDPVAEAADVRAMADAVRVSDPHFAADLYAAADRHEALYASEGAR
jgi:hypothetical protein